MSHPATPSAEAVIGQPAKIQLEKVWFDEAITCRSRAETGIAAGPDESFALYPDDSIATVRTSCASNSCMLDATSCVQAQRPVIALPTVTKG